MEKTILRWLKGRSAVALADIRKELGKPAMDLFMVHHKDWGYSFCMECKENIAKPEEFEDLNYLEEDAFDEEGGLFDE
jgi:hypothetical protein